MSSCTSVCLRNVLLSWSTINHGQLYKNSVFCLFNEPQIILPGVTMKWTVDFIIQLIILCSLILFLLSDLTCSVLAVSLNYLIVFFPRWKSAATEYCFSVRWPQQWFESVKWPRQWFVSVRWPHQWSSSSICSGPQESWEDLPYGAFTQSVLAHNL